MHEHDFCNQGYKYDATLKAKPQFSDHWFSLATHYLTKININLFSRWRFSIHNSVWQQSEWSSLSYSLFSLCFQLFESFEVENRKVIFN